jgi:hypothetical protein
VSAWLCSLFPDAGPTVTEEMLKVMEGQEEDPRAVFFCSKFSLGFDQ